MGWEEAQDPEVLSNPKATMTGKDWWKKDEAGLPLLPETYLPHIRWSWWFCTGHGSSPPLAQGLPGHPPPLCSWGTRYRCGPNAQVPQSPGPCLRYSPFFVAFHQAAKEREKHSARLSLSQGS